MRGVAAGGEQHRIALGTFSDIDIDAALPRLLVASQYAEPSKNAVTAGSFTPSRNASA
jgi:hypothetical protein